MPRRPKILAKHRGRVYIALFDDDPTDEQYELLGDYLVFIRRKIDPDPTADRRFCTWDIQRDRHGRVRVLVTCPDCAWISDITSHAIHYNGFVNYDMRPSCIACPGDECNQSYWPYLHGWGNVSAKIKREVEAFGKENKVRIVAH